MVVGRAIGAAVIGIDELLRNATTRYSLPALAVGLGMYLPMELTLLIPIGALIGWLYNRWAEQQSNPAFVERIGTLLATGLIVGESLMGVAYAGVVAGAERAGVESSGEVLALVENFAQAVPWGSVLFFGSIAWLYSWTRGQAKGCAAARRAGGEGGRRGYARGWPPLRIRRAPTVGMSESYRMNLFLSSSLQGAGPDERRPIPHHHLHRSGRLGACRLQRVP